MGPVDKLRHVLNLRPDPAQKELLKQGVPLIAEEFDLLNIITKLRQVCNYEQNEQVINLNLVNPTQIEEEEKDSENEQ